MKIVEKAVMPDRTKIQIENWSADYPGTVYAWMIGAYPIAKRGSEKYFGPRKGRPFRCGLIVPDEAEARSVFDRLLHGSPLTDFKDRFRSPEDVEYLGD